MILTICILVLVYLMMGKPVGELLDELKQVDWKAKFAELWEKLKTYALKAGRVATKPILTFYYVMRNAETTTLEKALIYGAIAYIVIPSDLLPRRVMGLLGILDDAAVIAYVYNRISKKITVEITNKVEETLDNWFGAEAVVLNA
ncbi:MAG: DUF1232 domain-containing protein [Bacteroidales bacterium]|nr:DUF1232 domain-containing protein [Bacteroidales bacterium]